MLVFAFKPLSDSIWGGTRKTTKDVNHFKPSGLFIPLFIHLFAFTVATQSLEREELKLAQQIRNPLNLKRLKRFFTA